MEPIHISPVVAARLREEADRCGLPADAVADALLADALGRTARACEENRDALQEAFDRLESGNHAPAFRSGLRPSPPVSSPSAQHAS